MPDATPDEFRQLLGRFATGVTILTARDAARRAWGMTASAVAAASLRPPLLLVCVDREREVHPVLESSGYFGLTVLSAEQEILSRRFAELESGRFDGVPHHEGLHGVPLVDGGVAHIVCAHHATVPAGDHTVFVGRVVGGETFDRRPLLYYRGRYHTLGGESAHG